MTEGACAVLESWGIGECILKPDQELAIGALVEQVAHRRRVAGHRVQVNAAPRRSHASMGIVENANRQVGNGVRVLELQLEKGLGRRIPIYHQIMAWLVRHVGWLIFLYAAGHRHDVAPNAQG